MKKKTQTDEKMHGFLLVLPVLKFNIHYKVFTLQILIVFSCNIRINVCVCVCV